MKVTHILARAWGKSIAYDTADEVDELLTEQRERLEDRQLPAHLHGAARLSGGSLVYQPGLVALAGEAHDSVLYLEALLTAARTSGHHDLADALQEAAAVQHEAAAVLEHAVHATLPAPQIPFSPAA